MTTEVTSASRVIDELCGGWPTICHGFSNEYFSVSPAVNQDGVEWLIFHYDYSDEVGSSTYPGLAVPAAKFSQEIVRALQEQSGKEIKCRINAIPVVPRSPSYSSRDIVRVPYYASAWELFLILDQDGHVAACLAAGTRFAKGPPLYLNKKEAVSLIINRDNLKQAHIFAEPWLKYVPE